METETFHMSNLGIHKVVCFGLLYQFNTEKEQTENGIPRHRYGLLGSTCDDLKL